MGTPSIIKLSEKLQNSIYEVIKKLRPFVRDDVEEMEERDLLELARDFEWLARDLRRAREENELYKP